ncbi:MAG: hypothetical protein ACP6IS_00110 [Candidatus Asgardarchaeia archaeon]
MPFFRKKKKKEEKDAYQKLRVQDVLSLVLGDYTLEKSPDESYKRWTVELMKMVEKKPKGNIEIILERDSFKIGYNEYEEKPTFDLYLDINLQNDNVTIGIMSPSILEIARLLPFIHQLDELSTYGLEINYSGGNLDKHYFIIRYPEEKREEIQYSEIPEDKRGAFNRLPFLEKIFDLVKKDPPEDTTVENLLKNYENPVKYLFGELGKLISS